MAYKGSLTVEESRAVYEKVKADFRKTLDYLGVNDELLAKKLLEELNATEPKTFQYKGDVIESKEKIAWEIRQRARQDAHKLRGDYPSEKHHVTVEGGLPVIQLSEEDRIEVDAIKKVLKEKALREDARKK